MKGDETMRRTALCLLLALLASLALLNGGAALAESEDLPEWTFMLYLCGSDLESAHGLASYNLREIASLWFPEKVVADTDDGLDLVDWHGGGDVNLVIETGGAKAWQDIGPDEMGNELGIEISPDRLQRYAVDIAYNEGMFGYVPSFRLVDEQPLQNMAAPDTLSDFIRWSASRYPAKKYGLLLWDHGGGSRTGLFVDELFENDIMTLDELDLALNGGGAHFELVAIDACLMCSLETAQAVAPYANYMVASEEEVAGYGSAFSDWVCELYRNPGCGGAELGCEFCDATQHKYAEQDNSLAETQMTFSLIRLDAIADVAAGFDRLFDYAGKLYETYFTRFNMFCNQLITGETYGAENANMVDLGAFLYNNVTISLVDGDIRNDLAAALERAVDYNTKGGGRSRSKGLSFCYSPDMTPEELNIYARNCHSAPYLALLDAVIPGWSAPEWVYETARRLTPIEQLENYRLDLQLVMREGELPKLLLAEGTGSMFTCVFNLYAMDGDLGTLYSLGDGQTLLKQDGELGNALYMMNENGLWPMIDGTPCSSTLIDSADSRYLFNVPIQVNYSNSNLRLEAEPVAGRDTYEFLPLGLWPGYDYEYRMPNRVVISLQQMQGQDYRLLYPCCNDDGSRQRGYRFSDTMTMPRGLDVEYAPLPAGEYWMCYTVKDIFRREYRTPLVKLYWDGERYTVMS